MDLEIADVKIRQDKQGRYCLNDLHVASGGESKHRPQYWLDSQATQELIAEIGIAGIPAILKKQGLGTFVCKELVYSYAMWISPRFSLRVIRSYDALMNGDKDRRLLRHATASGAKAMADIVQQIRVDQGKAVAAYHFANEHRMVNWALTGEFCSVDRDSLAPKELDVLAKLQARNSVLIGRGVDYNKRKAILEQFAIDLHCSKEALLAS
jgi:hypothetical protein